MKDMAAVGHLERGGGGRRTREGMTMTEGGGAELEAEVEVQGEVHSGKLFPLACHRSGFPAICPAGRLRSDVVRARSCFASSSPGTDLSYRCMDATSFHHHQGTVGPAVKLEDSLWTAWRPK